MILNGESESPKEPYYKFLMFSIMRCKSESTIVERALQGIEGFSAVFAKIQQQVILKGQSQSTYHNYIRQIAKVCLHFGRLPEDIPEEEINEFLTGLARRPCEGLNPRRGGVSASLLSAHPSVPFCQNPLLWYSGKQNERSDKATTGKGIHRRTIHVCGNTDAANRPDQRI